jgi:cytochrome c oxidase subunit IV
MSGSHNKEHNEDHNEPHIVPVSTYIAVFVALLAGTALTTAVAKIDLGAFNTVVALIIAFAKMSLVILFFMHVKYEKGLTRIAILCAFFWLAIMITFTLSDELTRTWEMNPQPWSSISAIVPFVSHLF